MTLPEGASTSLAAAGNAPPEAGHSAAGLPAVGKLRPDQILESISDAFVAVDRDWRFAYANPKAEQVFRMPREQLIGRFCWDLFPEGVRTQGRLKLEAAMSEGRSVYYLEYSLRYGIWFEVTAYPYADGLSIYFRDVTDRVTAEQRLKLHQQAIEASVNAIVITTGRRQHYSVVHVNPAFERITGYSAQEVLGRNLGFLQGVDADQPELAALRCLLAEQKEGRVTLRNYRKDGRLFYNELHVSPVRDAKGRASHFVGILNDITETRRYQEELERHINHDALTGLANRHLLHDRLEQAIRRSERRTQSCAVIFIDVDHFKLVNDSLGHHWGDLLLKSVASELLAAVRPEDTVARFGGDEFVVIASDINTSDTIEIVQRVLDRLSTAQHLENEDVSVTASLGVALFPQDGTTVQELLKNADAAMYHAKDRGRNTYSLYHKDMNGSISTRFAMKAKLTKAIENGELEVHYQPQVAARGGELVGFEALVRWKNPDLGCVSPERFIPLAEDSGLIVPIGEWVLMNACRLARTLLARGTKFERMSVNLSARQFYQADLVKVIERILRDAGLSADNLELEITESMMMGQTEKVLRILSELKEMNIKLAVDDFGTGYSSLGYLRRFPLDRLKIDRSFIDDVPASHHDATLTQAIIALGHNLGLRVIAEGVETVAQREFLARNGCDELQGYLLSKPLDEAALAQFLEQQKKRVRRVAAVD